MIKKLLVSACVLLSFSVLATTLPPITIYIGYTPGSNSDKILRAVQVELQKEIQNPIRVDYKPGAGGDVAVGFIANNTKKETTLLITNINLPWWNITKNTTTIIAHYCQLRIWELLLKFLSARLALDSEQNLIGIN
jgi:tripartite-type tricarboxylate transporter receptor subunit TctC